MVAIVTVVAVAVTGRLVVPGRFGQGLSHQVPGRDRARRPRSTTSTRICGGRRADGERLRSPGGVGRRGRGPHAVAAHHRRVGHHAGRLEGAEEPGPHRSRRTAWSWAPAIWPISCDRSTSRSPPSPPTTRGQGSVASWVKEAGGSDSFGAGRHPLPRDQGVRAAGDQLAGAVREGAPRRASA